MEELVTIKIKDLDIARSMLQLAGYYSSDSMSDEEVFEKVLGMIECYGAEWKILGKKD